MSVGSKSPSPASLLVVTTIGIDHHHANRAATIEALQKAGYRVAEGRFFLQVNSINRTH